MAVPDSRRPPDAELVDAAKRGSKEAFVELVGRHRPMVFTLTRRLLLDDDLAADAVQEATIVALVGLERLRSPERFGPWYAGIGLNTARRMLRRPVVSPMPAEHADEAPGPDEQVTAAEIATRVRRAVAELPRGQKQAVLAFYWGGLTHAEAALELGISPGAVKARLHQARASLSESLVSHLTDQEAEASVMTTEEPIWIDVDTSVIPATANPSWASCRRAPRTRRSQSSSHLHRCLRGDRSRIQPASRRGASAHDLSAGSESHQCHQLTSS